MPLALPYAWTLPASSQSWLLMPCAALAFKLMFSSGVCKLRSKCPEWQGLTAMDYHYWTQPLPHPASWFMHHLPRRFHQAAVGYPPHGQPLQAETLKPVPATTHVGA